METMSLFLCSIFDLINDNSDNFIRKLLQFDKPNRLSFGILFFNMMYECV